MVNARDTRFCFAAVPSNLRLVYVKQTFSQNCIFQRPSRVHRMHILKIKCRLAYTKCPLFFKNVVSSTQNTYLVQRIHNWAQTRMLLFGEIIKNALYLAVSRLRRTHISKKRDSPPGVPSTPNAHSKNQVSSRLRQMLFVLEK